MPDRRQPKLLIVKLVYQDVFADLESNFAVQLDPHAADRLVQSASIQMFASSVEHESLLLGWKRPTVGGPTLVHLSHTQSKRECRCRSINLACETGLFAQTLPIRTGLEKFAAAYFACSLQPLQLPRTAIRKPSLPHVPLASHAHRTS